MKAEYRFVPAYPDNPFISSLPKRLTAGELMEKIQSSIPPWDRSVQMSSVERLSHCNKIYEAFYPLHFAPTIYNLLYNGMISSYAEKNSVKAIRQMTTIKTAIDLNQRPCTTSFSTQSISCSILGASGIGKSSTIARILNLFPQVIEHMEFEGSPFFCKQINYLNVQCPSDCSVKAMCTDILLQIDRILGTEYAVKAMRRQSVTLDALVAQLSQLCITHNIGVIIIDEIQNVLSASTKSGNHTRLVRFLVQLMNDTGICAVLVGTPEVGAFFDSEPHLARRTRGLRIGALGYGEPFHHLLAGLWKMQYTKIYQPLTEKLEGLLFEISGGIPALLAQVIALSQTQAIESGAEVLSEEVIRKTASLYRLRAPSDTNAVTDPASDFQAVKSILPQDEPQGKRGRPKRYRDSGDLLVLFQNNRENVSRLKERLMSLEMLEVM